MSKLFSARWLDPSEREDTEEIEVEVKEVLAERMAEDLQDGAFYLTPEEARSLRDALTRFMEIWYGDQGGA